MTVLRLSLSLHCQDLGLAANAEFVLRPAVCHFPFFEIWSLLKIVRISGNIA